MTTLDATRLRIDMSERAVFIGQTGSGKTTLAKAIAWKAPNFRAIDPKRTFRFPVVDSWPVTYTDSVQDVIKWNSHLPIVYRPSREEMNSDPQAERFFEDCFERGNVIVYVDEVTRVTTPHKLGDGYKACLQLGRERNVSTWSATQRPAKIPLEIMSESEHWFVFALRVPEDRDRVAGYIGRETQERQPSGHGFWYFNDTLPANKKLRYYNSAKVGGIAK